MYRWELGAAAQTLSPDDATRPDGSTRIPDVLASFFAQLKEVAMHCPSLSIDRLFSVFTVQLKDGKENAHTSMNTDTHIPVGAHSFTAPFSFLSI